MNVVRAKSAQPQESSQPSLKAKSTSGAGVASTVLRFVTGALAVSSVGASRSLRAETTGFNGTDSFAGLARASVPPTALATTPFQAPVAPAPPVPANFTGQAPTVGIQANSTAVGASGARFPLSVDVSGIKTSFKFGGIQTSESQGRPQTTLATNGFQSDISEPRPTGLAGYAFNPLPPGFSVFSGPSTADDIRQGTLADAWFHASVVAVMTSGQPVPLTNATGTNLQARFFAQGGIPDPILISNRAPVTNNLAFTNNEWTVDLQTRKAWPGLLAKAYYRYTDIYPTARQQPRRQGWDDSQNGSPLVPLATLTGNPVTVRGLQSTNEQDMQAIATNKNLAKVLCTIGADLITSAPGFDPNTQSVTQRGVTMQLFADKKYVALSGTNFGDSPAALALSHCYAVTDFSNGRVTLQNPQHNHIFWDLKRQSAPIQTDVPTLAVDFQAVRNVGLQLLHVDVRR